MFDSNPVTDDQSSFKSASTASREELEYPEQLEMMRQKNIELSNKAQHQPQLQQQTNQPQHHQTQKTYQKKSSTYTVPTATATPAIGSQMTFITRKGCNLYEGTNIFRFISYNIPNLHFLEDRGQRTFPTKFEQTDALRSIAQMGGRATRTYVISVAAPGDDWSYVHIAPGTAGNGPPKNPGSWIQIPAYNNSVTLYANEELFIALDNAITIASSFGIRLIIPLVDKWEWWGGINQYVAIVTNGTSKNGDLFFTNPLAINAFKSVISYILNRKNTVNGVLYKQDPAILTWETGNELCVDSTNGPPPGSWTNDIAKFIKSIDSNHLVMDGTYGYQGGWDQSALTSTYIDIFSNHYYDVDKPAWWTGPFTYVNRAKTETKFISSFEKVLIIGEFGLAPYNTLKDLVVAFVSLPKTSGLMIWSLRFHARDGGFYVHSENFPYEAYHHPGFVAADGFPADEAQVVPMMRDNALKLAPASPYHTEPPTPAPTILNTLATSSVSGSAAMRSVDLKWTGSTGARNYTVERSVGGVSGPWTVVTTVADNKPFGKTLYTDSSIPAGTGGVWYRVTGTGDFGKTPVSSVVQVL
ncbi:hypothetical protein HDU76_002089 [Blyttiomyces sp. JEL0837]|nr:hypothetical protein HDU76_002089 [Blyttiomyces sp. JEL0837]